MPPLPGNSTPATTARRCTADPVHSTPRPRHRAGNFRQHTHASPQQNYQWARRRKASNHPSQTTARTTHRHPYSHPAWTHLPTTTGPIPVQIHGRATLPWPYPTLTHQSYHRHSSTQDTRCRRDPTQRRTLHAKHSIIPPIMTFDQTAATRTETISHPAPVHRSDTESRAGRQQGSTAQQAPPFFAVNMSS